MNSLSIVIPVFNEEKVIQKTIAQIDCFYKNKNLNLEIIVVNDGSIDNTKSILETYSHIKGNNCIIAGDHNINCFIVKYILA